MTNREGVSGRGGHMSPETLLSLTWLMVLSCNALWKCLTAKIKLTDGFYSTVLQRSTAEYHHLVSLDKTKASVHETSQERGNAESDTGTCDMELKMPKANTRTHTTSRGRPLYRSHTTLFVVFVCCFHGNMPPRYAAYRWNRLKSVEKRRESYFCSLGAQCGSNRQKFLRALISFHTWT